MKPSEYTPAAKALHWLIALLIFVLLPLGWLMDDLPKDTPADAQWKFEVFNFHKSLGFTVLLLMVLRIAWRYFNPPPALPASMPEIQKKAATGMHHLIYLTVIVVALAGWAMISASTKPSVLFQLTSFPLLPWLKDLPAADKKAYHEVFEAAHSLIGYFLVALVAAHVALALYHGIVLKDGIYTSIKPNFGKRRFSITAGLLMFGLGALAAGGGEKAAASEWSIKPEASQIAFEATGGGQTARGTFAQYRAEIEFDPDLPEQTAVRVLLDMNSAATGDTDTDQQLKSADFFNPGQFPTAQFTARGAQPAGSGKYVLNGRLTLKGVTKPVSLPFLIDVRSGTARVNAGTTINRLDFGVGPQSLAGLAIDKDVKLSIDLTAVRLDN
ncbi:MAG: YceI family protein [Rhodomicrobium sp.]